MAIFSDAQMIQVNDSAVSDTNTNVTNTQVLDSQHSDYIHKVAFDVYGRRMATCSGDRSVRVWDMNDEGTWTLASSWQAHRSTVTSVAWAHPEFGSLLATSGSDHDCKIWEETKNNSWMVKAALTEARRAVTCVAFGPRHLGLKLAVGSADGNVRIYEAVDVTNVSQWPLAATLQSFDETYGCTSVSWSTGRFEPPTLVAAGAHCVVYRYSEQSRSWLPIVRTPPPEKGNVVDVAWAPNIGRRFHYIASAEHDRLRVYKLSRGGNDGYEETKDDGSSSKQLMLDSSHSIVANAWCCQWNVTGTVLAASGDGGVVQLYKQNAHGQFECVSTVQTSDDGDVVTS